MLNPAELKKGQWFLLDSNECVELEVVSQEPQVPCPVLLKDKDGALRSYDLKGRYLAKPDSKYNIKRQLPAPLPEVSLKNMTAGQLVLFRDNTLGILETLPAESANRYQYGVRSLVTNEVTQHSSHGWAWHAEEPSRDIVVCFAPSRENKQHKANADSLRKMIARLADSVAHQTKAERTREFERARAGINHLLDKMEEDLDDC